MPLITDHPYLACALAFGLGAFFGWVAFAILPALIRETAAPDHDDVTGIGA